LALSSCGNRSQAGAWQRRISRETDLDLKRRFGTEHRHDA
jgi:hypothetical protein